MFCNTYFPLKADVYYATQTQNDFGEVNKEWSYDQNIRIELAMSTNYKDQQIQAEQFLFVQDMLNGRTLVDPRISSDGEMYAFTDVLLTNIQNDRGEHIYLETTGVREGKDTLYELAGTLPHNGPFGQVDYYKVVIKRSDAQELKD